MPFKVIYEDSDTRINEYSEEYLKNVKEKYETYEEAKKAATDYLEDLIMRCQERLNWLKSLDTLEK